MTTPFVLPEIKSAQQTRTCSCGQQFEVIVKYAESGGRRWPFPAPRLCGECWTTREQKALQDGRGRDAWERRREADRLAKIIPSKYHDAEFTNLKPGAQQHLAAWLETPFSIYMSGTAGTGKTYTAAALLRAAWGASVHSAAWANVPTLLDELRRSMNQADRTSGQIEELCSATVVVLDDIGAEKPSEWVLDRLYVIVNSRYERELPTVFTSNLPLSQLYDRLGSRIASRLAEMTQQFEIGGDDRRMTA
jgi:DNA replication protein DnaC